MQNLPCKTVHCTALCNHSSSAKKCHLLESGPICGFSRFLGRSEKYLSFNSFLNSFTMVRCTSEQPHFQIIVDGVITQGDISGVILGFSSLKTTCTSYFEGTIPHWANFPLILSSFNIVWVFQYKLLFNDHIIELIAFN